MNKQYRLKKSFEIEKLFKKKISVGNAYFIMYYNQSSITNTRVAISVSKKIGNAVKIVKMKIVLKKNGKERGDGKEKQTKKKHRI